MDDPAVFQGTEAEWQRYQQQVREMYEGNNPAFKKTDAEIAAEWSRLQERMEARMNPEDKNPQRLTPELAAMSTVGMVLADLNPEERKRVLDWAHAKYFPQRFYCSTLLQPMDTRNSSR